MVDLASGVTSSLLANDDWFVASTTRRVPADVFPLLTSGAVPTIPVIFIGVVAPLEFTIKAPAVTVAQVAIFVVSQTTVGWVVVSFCAPAKIAHKMMTMIVS